MSYIYIYIYTHTRFFVLFRLVLEIILVAFAFTRGPHDGLDGNECTVVVDISALECSYITWTSTVALITW